MSERGRMLLIFGIIGGVLVGAAVFFLGYFQPARARKAAQAEIAEWEAQWLKARECVIGKTQASTDVGEALAIRELEADVANRGNCTKLVGTLTRGAGDATEIDSVERAWQAIDFAAGKVATSYVSQVASSRATDDEKIETLAEALAEMDAAHAALRSAADMSALPPRASSALPKATLTSLQLGSSRIVREQLTTMSSGVMLVLGVATGPTDFRDAWIVHEAGKDPLVMQVGTAERSFPDLGWGAVGTADGIVTGTLDNNGLMPTPGATLAIDEQRASVGEGVGEGERGRGRGEAIDGDPEVVLALGNATKGLVVYSRHAAPLKPGEAAAIARRFTIARSTDGKLESEPLQTYTVMQRSVDPSGRALVAWSDGSGAIRGAILHPDQPTKWIDLGSGELEFRDRSCIADRTGWLATGDQLIAFDDAGARPRVFPDHILIGCTRDAALLQARGTAKLAICKAECRIAELAGAHPAAVPVMVVDHAHSVGGHRKVLARWSERTPVRYFAVDEAFAPLHATSDGKVIDVLGRTSSGLAIVRLPAS